MKARLSEPQWVQFDQSHILHRLVQGAKRDLRYAVKSYQGETMCGRTGHLWYPGLVSRMSAPRCKRCCRAVDVENGNGHPRNGK